MSVNFAGSKLARLGAGALLALAMTGSAFAHSFLVDANPSSKDHVEASPKTVKLRFGGGVEPPYSKLTLENDAGKVLAEGSIGKPDKPRELSMDVGVTLDPGRYVVRYRVLFDGWAHRRRQLRVLRRQALT